MHPLIALAGLLLLPATPRERKAPPSPAVGSASLRRAEPRIAQPGRASLPASRGAAVPNAHRLTPDAPKEISLFDGKTWGGWKKTSFAAGGDVTIEPKFKDYGPVILVEMGDTLTGFNWQVGAAELPDGTKPDAKLPEEIRKIKIPKTNYEVSLEVMKLEGSDFPLGLTFPVGDSHASFIFGGWGGSTVGISSIDDLDASENSARHYLTIEKDKWYKIRVRVTPDKLQVFLDDKSIIDEDIKGKKISLRSGEISKSIPLGISTFRTKAAFRKLTLKPLPSA